MNCSDWQEHLLVFRHSAACTVCTEAGCSATAVCTVCTETGCTATGEFLIFVVLMILFIHCGLLLYNINVTLACVPPFSCLYCVY
jgi:hypothetical protein